MKVTLRKIRPDDAKQLAAICEATNLHSWSAESFEREADNPIACYYVLEEGDALIGFAGIWCVVDEAQVMNVGILPEYQRKGYGRMLMDALWTFAVQAGCTVMTLEVKEGNVPALSLYASMGFEQTGFRKDYYPDHSNGILMTKKPEDIR